MGLKMLGIRHCFKRFCLRKEFKIFIQIYLFAYTVKYCIKNNTHNRKSFEVEHSYNSKPFKMSLSTRKIMLGWKY